MKETIPDAETEHLLRELAPQVLGAVVRRFRDFAAAEDAVQEAMLAAFTQWPREGIPKNPRGWVVSTARFKAIDAMRRKAKLEESLGDIAQPIEQRPARMPWPTLKASKTTGCD